MQSACAVLYSHLWPLRFYHYPHSHTHTVINDSFREKKITEHKSKVSYSRQILMRLEFSRQSFEKYSNIKFHKDPSGWIRIVPCGWARMTKLRLAFRNLANAPQIRIQKPVMTCALWRHAVCVPAMRTCALWRHAVCVPAMRTCALWRHAVCVPVCPLRI